VALRARGFVDLPEHAKAGGFDHAAVHQPTGRVYVAHTANDAVDVIDIETQKYGASIPGLSAVAGALVADDADLVFTSNRGENTVGVFAAGNEGRHGFAAASRASGGMGAISRPPM
jgi:DNA-binding beta-propeller fold protein YncE